MRVYSILLTILMTSFVWACSQTSIEQIERNIPVVIDSLPFTENQVEKDGLCVPENAIEWHGDMDDTINVYGFDEWQFNWLMTFDYRRSKKLTNKLQIWVETNQDISIELNKQYYPPPPIFVDGEIDSVQTQLQLKEWKKRPRKYAQALPVFIVNSSTDSAYLEMEDGCVSMIREAKTREGEWKPIEYWAHSTCGNSYGEVRMGQTNLSSLRSLNIPVILKRK